MKSGACSLGSKSGVVAMAGFRVAKSFLKAREFLRPFVEDGYTPSNDDARNISAKLSPWDIELHTDMYCDLSEKIDRGIKEVQNCVFSHHTDSLGLTL